MIMERNVVMELPEKTVAVKITVTKEGIQWTNRKNGLCETGYLEYKQILGSQKQGCSVHVHYIKVVVGKGNNVVLRHDTAVFIATDVVSKDVCDAIKINLKETQSHRPQRILIFINPASGSQTSVTSYKDVVEPVFKKSNVTAHTIVTQDSKHAMRVMHDYSLSQVDAVVSMGGDGSYGHVFDAFIKKSMRDAGVDMDDENVAPVKPRIPFGVLPAGSGCAVARMVNSSIDLETCVISIVLGKTAPSDISVIRERGSLVRYSIFVGSSGTYSNAFAIIERLRFFRKARYWFIVPILWWVLSVHDIELQYLPVSRSRHAHYGEDELNLDAGNLSSSTVDGPDWKTFRGTISGLNFVHSRMVKFFKWIKSSPYESPIMSSGAYCLLIDKSKSFWQLVTNYLTFTRKTATSDAEEKQDEMFEQIEVSEMKVRWLDSEAARVHIDGEECGVMEYAAKMYAKAYDILVIDDDLVSLALSYESDQIS